MKKPLLCIVCLFIFLDVACAQQTSSTSSSAEKRINLLSRVMASELGLNESEYLRLQSLNRERVIKADEIAELYGNDQEMLTKKLKELEISFDKKFTAMLSPSQLATYSKSNHRPNAQIALSGENTSTNNAPANQIK